MDFEVSYWSPKTKLYTILAKCSTPNQFHICSSQHTPARQFWAIAILSHLLLRMLDFLLKNLDVFWIVLKILDLPVDNTGPSRWKWQVVTLSCFCWFPYQDASKCARIAHHQVTRTRPHQASVNPINAEDLPIFFVDGVSHGCLGLGVYMCIYIYVYIHPPDFLMHYSLKVSRYVRVSTLWNFWTPPKKTEKWVSQFQTARAAPVVLSLLVGFYPRGAQPLRTFAGGKKIRLPKIFQVKRFKNEFYLLNHLSIEYMYIVLYCYMCSFRKMFFEKIGWKKTHFFQTSMLSIELLNVKDAFGTWEASNLSETSSSQHGSNDVIWHISSFRTCAGHKNSRGPREISRQGKPHSPTHMRVNQTSDYICAYIYIYNWCHIYIYIYTVYIFILYAYIRLRIYTL